MDSEWKSKQKRRRLQLKIGILEWICGGGLLDIAPSQVPESLLREGWAMLSTVAQDFTSCGHEVISSVDARSLERLHLSASELQFEPTFISGFQDDLPSSWWAIAADSDVVVVIAPEFSNILRTAVSKLSRVCSLLLNCSGDFLAASCDKWLTAQRLSAAGISHPATQLACDVTKDWIEQHRNQSGRWIIKPRDGAGCDAIQLVNDECIHEALSAIRSSDLNSRMMLQPLHNGAAFSRSAIVDFAGYAHWLPLVTQEFSITESIVYRGGRVLDVGHWCYEGLLNGRRYSIDQLNEVLNATVGSLGPGALGWVGVDLLYSDELNDWLVIEVNPRLTTSFTGLRLSYGTGLMEQMLRGGRGQGVAIDREWKSIAFDSAGNLYPSS